MKRKSKTHLKTFNHLKFGFHPENLGTEILGCINYFWILIEPYNELPVQ
jgi:hypothetical protein